MNVSYFTPENHAGAHKVAEAIGMFLEQTDDREQIIHRVQREIEQVDATLAPSFDETRDGLRKFAASLIETNPAITDRTYTLLAEMGTQTIINGIVSAIAQRRGKATNQERY